MIEDALAKLVKTAVAEAEDLPPVLGAAAAASLLGVTRNTVTRWARAGKVPARQLGCRWYFSRDRLLGYIANQP